jgi:soluble lytic murein transglycosylase-like protein
MPMHPLFRQPARLATLACALAFLLLSSARADCIADAAARHHVNAEVLRAIGWQESRLQPQALGRNANGSIDFGAFQINSVHLSELGRYGIDRAALADGCVSAEVAAWHYRRQIDRQGNSWQAVGAYHSATPARAAGYANRIAAILMAWQVLAPGALPFPPDRTLAPGRPPPSAHPARRVSAQKTVVPSAPTSPPADTHAAADQEIAYRPTAR